MNVWSMGAYLLIVRPGQRGRRGVRTGPVQTLTLNEAHALLEAIVMSGLGGLLGVLAGVGGAEAIARLSEFGTVIKASSVVLALSVSTAVGIFFGLYPARRAALLDPIDALRYE